MPEHEGPAESSGPRLSDPEDARRVVTGSATANADGAVAGEQSPRATVPEESPEAAGHEASEDAPALAPIPVGESGSDQDQDEHGYGEFRKVIHQVVNNHFHDRVDAGGSVFGVGTASRLGLTPGLVDLAEVDKALEFYMPPQPHFSSAQERLTSRNVVSLVGQDGTGRRAAAFALLREVLGGHAQIRSLSPATSLAELADSSAVKPGHGYVILDYVGDVQSAGVQEFEMRRLSSQLRKSGSFLVVTSSEQAIRLQSLKSFCVRWSAPDPSELFNHCLKESPDTTYDPERLDELRALVSTLRRPDDVVAVARTLAERGLEHSLESLRSGERARVHAWFRDPTRSAEDTLTVAALAFAEGLPERTFEKVLFGLTLAVRNWEHTMVGATVEAAVPALPELRIEQSRSRWSVTTTGLIEARRDYSTSDDQIRVERCVFFVSPRIRELVLEQLNELYGLQLWQPLRQWLTHLSQNGDLQLRTEIAAGLALLARYALAEVEENHLDVWSAGYVSQRVTAALTVQFMSADPQLASHALNLALQWADKRGPVRAVTAAMALVGLGRPYQFESLNWLWYLSARGERVAWAARSSLYLLLAAAEDDERSASLTLRYVRTRMETAREPREQSRAATAAMLMLSGPSLDGSSPLAAGLLRNSSPVAGPLGRLWARLLLSNRRRAALDALCTTLSALRDEPDLSHTVRSLGGSMQEAMTERQWKALRRDLLHLLSHPDYAEDETQRLARFMLGLLRDRS